MVRPGTICWGWVQGFLSTIHHANHPVTEYSYSTRVGTAKTFKFQPRLPDYEETRLDESNCLLIYYQPVQALLHQQKLRHIGRSERLHTAHYWRPPTPCMVQIKTPSYSRPVQLSGMERAAHEDFALPLHFVAAAPSAPCRKLGFENHRVV